MTRKLPAPTPTGWLLPGVLSAAVSRKRAHSAEAQRLVEFLATPQARSYFMENGFRAPAAGK